jgi:molecular chaperone DnaK
MPNTHVTVGIDHGTTNSSLAVLRADEVEVLQVDGPHDVMPSAVYIDRHKREFVGRPAYEAIRVGRPGQGDGHTGYKLRIGQDDRFPFPAAQAVKTAPELGAMVIGRMLQAYEEAFREKARAAVITVPAKFGHAECEGTGLAAEKAGLLYYPLLQEPVAAALAYGFEVSDERAKWMVFDLGGGTFDVSLVYVRKGSLDVPEDGHAGNNHLGGGKFDIELLEHVLKELKKRYSLERFRPNDPDYGPAWRRLLSVVEQAKIELSTRPESFVQWRGTLCKDDNGREVKVEVPVARADYERLIGPDIDRAVQICENLLTQNRLTPRDIDRLILVGGPTQTPFLQEVLIDRLGIPLLYEIDPMTVVARGAVLHASRLDVPEEIRRLISLPSEGSTGASVQLSYEHSSRQPTCQVAGRVTGTDPSDLTVRFDRQDGGWSSAAVTVGPDGIFEAELFLLDTGRPARSRFRTRVLDAAGEVLCEADEPMIWYPSVGITNPARLANSLRIAVPGNRTAVLVRQGAELPSRGRRLFQTTKTLRRGSGDDLLNIPVLEGVTSIFGEEDDHPDCCLRVASLQIRGDDEKVTMDLDVGTEIEVTLTQDESRRIQGTAYVTDLRAEFSVDGSRSDFGEAVEQTIRAFPIERQRLERIRRIQSRRGLPSVQTKLDEIDRLGFVEEIEKNRRRWREEGDRDAQLRAYKSCIAFRGGLNHIERLQQRPRIECIIEDLLPMAQQGEKAGLERIRADFAAAREEDLDALQEALSDLDYRIRLRHWDNVIVDLNALDGRMVSPKQAAVFKEADRFTDDLVDRGGIQNATEDDLKKLEEFHRRFQKHYDDLEQARETYWEKRKREGRDKETHVKEKR